MIEIRGVDQNSVRIYVPPGLQEHIRPGHYPIGDATDAAPRMTADFFYSELPISGGDPLFKSYAETGEIVLSEVSEFVSGTFKFGARNMDGRQVNVEGSFTNIPFVHTNAP
jgi:hypothetical protein